MVCLMCVSVLSIQFSILLFLLGNYGEQGSRPWTENILKSTFQIDITFEVCSMRIHQKFYNCVWMHLLFISANHKIILSSKIRDI